MTYTYNISAFPNSVVDPYRLNLDILNSTITTALDHIDSNPDEVFITFKGTLSAPDQTTLDTLVSTHNINSPLPVQPTVFPVNLEYQGIGSDITFGTPRPTPLLDFSKIFTSTQIQVLGSKGPNLSNLIDFAITYDSVQKILNTLYLDTNNGIPGWYVNLLPNSSHNFFSEYPSLTLKDTSIEKLDGDYWANIVDNNNFALASKSGNFTILLRNSSTGYIPIQYNTNFALLDSSNQMYNSNIPANLFGTQFNFVYDASESTTTSTTFQTKSTLTVKNLPIGTYRISVSYVGSGSSTSYQYETKTLINGIQEGATQIQRVSNTANYEVNSRTFYKVLSGNVTILSQYRSNNALGTARIRDSVIELWRVN